jgi:hypothetical protein
MVGSTETDNEYQKIRDNSWKQFSVLDNLSGIVQEVHKTHYLLVSQDCDIVQRSFDKEKNVEIIQIIEVEKPNKSNTNLKNFRTPHILFTANGEEKHYQINMGERFFVDRKILAEVVPIAGIVFDKKTQKMIIELLNARYERTALPDAFNARFPFKKVKELLKDHSHDTYAFFIDVQPEEELSGDEYYVRLIMLVIKREDAHDELLENIVEEIKDGINVVEYRVKTMDEMSVGEYFEFKKLWLMELSYQGDEADVHL